MKTNYYQLLSTPVSFHINLKNLHSQFIKKQLQNHPDKQGQVEQSMLINQAYSTLKDPLKRIEYLLQIEKPNSISMEPIQRPEQMSVNPNENTEPMIEYEFLQEMMELQEDIMEATQQKLIDLKQENQDKIDNCIQKIGELYRIKDWAAIQKQATKLRYFYNCKKLIVDCQEE